MVNVTIEDLIVIRDIKVLSNKDNGLFIAMLNKKNSNGTFNDIVHPISVLARSFYEKLLFAETEKMMKEKRNSLRINKNQKRSFTYG